MNGFAALALPVDQPARMVIIHPVTGQRLCAADGGEAYLDLHSLDSPQAERRRRDLLQRRLDAGDRRRLSVEEAERERLDLLAALIAGWRLLDLDGRPLDLPFSPAAARDLLATPGMAWLCEQVDAFASDRANFWKASLRT